VIVEGHAGQQTVAALRAFGTDVMFTLNGGHIWPFYYAARDQGMRIGTSRPRRSPPRRTPSSPVDRAWRR
jgi:hypothetical protein